MKMNFKKLLPLLFFFAFYNALTQDFEKGYWVLLNGDTVRGEILDLHWKKNPDQITVRNSDGTVVLKASEVKFFKSENGNPYIGMSFKFIGDRLGHYYSYPNFFTPGFPSSRIPTKWIEKTCFLEVILQDFYSLYGFVDDDGRDHFFIQKQGEMNVEELQNHEYIAFGTTLRSNDGYKVHLQQISKECRDLQSKIVRLKYRKDDVADILLQINKCLGYNKGTLASSAQHRSVIAVSPSFTIYSMAIPDFGFGMDKPRYGFGVNAEIFSRSRPNRQSIAIEINYKKVNRADELNPTKNSLRFVSVKSVFGFRFYNKSAKQYFVLGPTAGLRSNVQGSGFRYVGVKKSGLDFGLVTGLGFNFRKIQSTAELRYEHYFPQNVFGLGQYFATTLTVSKRVFTRK